MKYLAQKGFKTDLSKIGCLSYPLGLYVDYDYRAVGIMLTDDHINVMIYERSLRPGFLKIFFKGFSEI